MPDSTDTYWASKSGVDLAQAAHERVKAFYTALPRLSMYRRWTKARRTYYGLSGQDDPFDISRLAAVGDEGQLTAVRVNHAGSIMRRQIGGISQTIPEWEPVPTNSDYDSLAQVSFTKQLLNYYMDTRKVGAKLFDAAQYAGTDGEGAVEIAWDAKAGPKLAPRKNEDGSAMLNPDGTPVPPDPLLPNRTTAGDLVFRVYSPIDLPCDLSRLDMEHDWRITRRPVNRFDVAARYPTLRNDVLGLKAEEWPTSTAPTDRLQEERTYSKDKSDLIPFYTLYHRKTDALPNGRIAEFLSPDILLWEGNLPYEDVPLVSVCPGKILRSPYGESPFHHILALQELYDLLASAVASNQAALALHLIWCPEGVDFSGMEFSEGFAILRGGDGPTGDRKPEVLNFNSANDVALRFMEVIERAMEMIGGVSASQRGAPPPNVRSGEFAALIAQQALEYVGQFAYSFQQAIAETGNLIVSILKQFADQPIVAEIAGLSHEYQLESFTKAKLDRIKRVVVKSGNPAARTPQFNIAMASDLLAKDMIPDAKTYINVVRTGQVDTMVSDAEADLALQRRENEQIAKGEVPPVSALDLHVEHIKSHRGTVASPAARANKKVTTAAFAHIQLHLNELKQVDPALLAILGQPSLMVPPPGAEPIQAGPLEQPPKGPHQGTEGPPGPTPPSAPKVSGQGALPSHRTPPLPQNAPQSPPPPPAGSRMV